MPSLTPNYCAMLLLANKEQGRPNSEHFERDVRGPNPLPSSSSMMNLPSRKELTGRFFTSVINE